MANIPLGDFAQARAIPQAAANRPDMRALDAGRGAAALAQGLDNVGDVLQGIAQQKQAQDNALARAEAANRALDDQIELDSSLDDYAVKLQSGEITWADAEAKFDESIAARPVQEIKGLGEVDQVNYKAMLKRNEFGARQKWQSVVGTHKKQYGATQVQSVMDKLLLGAENPAADPDKIIEQGAGTRALWAGTNNNPAEFEPKFSAFSDKVYDKTFAARMNTVIDNPEGLLKLRGELANDGYWGQRLGPEKANTMIGRIDTKIDSIKNDIDRDERKQDKLAEKLVGDVADQLEIGQNPGDDRVLQAAELAGSRPELKARLVEAQQIGAVVNEISGKPRAVQEAWISDQEAQLNANGGTEKEYARLGKIKATLARKSEARQNNPMGDPVLAPAVGPLNWNDQASVAGELSARLASLEAVREKNPDYGMRLLLPAEAAQLSDAFKKTPPEKLPALMTGLYQGNGDKVFGLLMEQIGAKDPVIAAAGKRLAADLKAERDPRVASGIAKGYAMLASKEKPIAMPKDAELGTAFATTFGSTKTGNGAYAGRPEDFASDIQAAKAYYANLTGEAGDISGEFDPERWEKAVQDVIGSPVDIEGYQVLPPIGMDPDKFESLADQEINAAIRRNGFNGGVFGNDFALRNVPGKPGLYFLINADQGGTIVRGKDGKTIGFDLND